MPRFSYTAIEAASGRERQGTLEGATAEAVTMRLKAKGLAPISLTADAGANHPAPRPASTRPARSSRTNPVLFGRVVSPKQLAVFTRQLAMLLKAGMPLLRSLEVLGRQQGSPGLRDAILGLADTIRSGGTLSDGLQGYPKIFDDLYVSMVRAGESGGVLETVLDRTAKFQEKTVRLHGRIKAAMTYPIIILLVASGIVAALMVFVVPRFEQIFTGTLKGQTLPLLTQWVLAVGNFAQAHLVTVLLTAGIAYWGTGRVARTRAGARQLDRLKLQLPVLGDLMRKAAIARFSRTFGTLLASGVPILQALTITRNTSGNVLVAEAIALVHDRVKAGDSVAIPLRGTGIFPDMVASMIEVGEETGALPEMLARIADSYDEEVDNAVMALTSMLEPLMIVVMAVLVGTIVIALFLPIVRIVQSLG